VHGAVGAVVSCVAEGTDQRDESVDCVAAAGGIGTEHQERTIAEHQLPEGPEAPEERVEAACEVDGVEGAHQLVGGRGGQEGGGQFGETSAGAERLAEGEHLAEQRQLVQVSRAGRGPAAHVAVHLGQQCGACCGTGRGLRDGQRTANLCVRRRG